MWYQIFFEVVREGRILNRIKHLHLSFLTWIDPSRQSGSVKYSYCEGLALFHWAGSFLNWPAGLVLNAQPGASPDANWRCQLGQDADRIEDPDRSVRKCQHLVPGFDENRIL